MKPADIIVIAVIVIIAGYWVVTEVIAPPKWTVAYLTVDTLFDGSYPEYSSKINVYGKVANLGENDHSFSLTFRNSEIEVWYDMMVYPNGTSKAPVSIVGIENGDWVRVSAYYGPGEERLLWPDAIENMGRNLDSDFYHTDDCEAECMGRGFGKGICWYTNDVREGFVSIGTCFQPSAPISSCFCYNIGETGCTQEDIETSHDVCQNL